MSELGGIPARWTPQLGIGRAAELRSRAVPDVPGSISTAMSRTAGWLRLSLTATDEMVEQALPVFKRAFDEAH